VLYGDLSIKNRKQLPREILGRHGQRLRAQGLRRLRCRLLHNFYGVAANREDVLAEVVRTAEAERKGRLGLGPSAVITTVGSRGL
jgi:hypothetical protein